MKESVEGPLRGRTRPSRIPPWGADVGERVMKLTLSDPPGSASHWIDDGKGLRLQRQRRQTRLAYARYSAAQDTTAPTSIPK